MGFINEIFVIFLISCFKIKAFVITDKKRVNIIMNKVKYSTYSDENKKPSGFCMGDWFIGHLHKSDSGINTYYQFFILTTDKQFEKIANTDQEYQIICTNNKSTVESDSDSIEKQQTYIWNRTGNFMFITYKKRLYVNYMEYQEIPKQSKIVEEIVEYYNKHKRGTFFISGEPGMGKSTVFLLLAEKFKKSNLCKQFRPYEPGDSIDYLYNLVEPTEHAPLIILMDEIDRMIDKVHFCKIITHKSVPIEIQDTASYNTFFDDINDKLYPYLIVILTSNCSKDDIDSIYHPCYLRDGRVNKYFTL